LGQKKKGRSGSQILEEKKRPARSVRRRKPTKKRKARRAKSLRNLCGNRYWYVEEPPPKSLRKVLDKEEGIKGILSHVGKKKKKREKKKKE